MSSPTNPIPVPPSKPSSWGVLRHMQTVLAVAVLLATLFTAWTPGETLWGLPGGIPVRSYDELPASSGGQPDELPAGVTPTPRTRPLIGIVSGHWGNDSGAVCDDGLTESEVNQTIASLVQKALVDQGFDVDLLYEYDERLRGYQASALISIHADSCQYVNDQATGYKVASALANRNPENSARLTACLRARYAQETGLPLHSTSVTNDMTYYHAFDEIDPGTTAAIIETGFLNLDRKFLTEQPEVAAQGIIKGVLCFINNESVPNSPVTPTSTP